jgi:hypothetical protein
VHSTKILHSVLYGRATWSLALKEEHSLSVFANSFLRTVFLTKEEKGRAVTLAVSRWLPIAGNASYHSVQNHLSSRLLSKNMKITI